ncbi:CAZyme family GT20 [Penicillium roqueforti]|nr:CAZyme family GT20 [Penicillium roqueforti]KAI3115114.1 CAZyme family GT20 [Penicillium roqueforti]KAI3202961.1 CAZyme family GT20 [Penicillium roqueforti]KAI3279051.1 CAZyme family GT20 [Penicillium roqueforti]KAI3293124.1 CAZyme family GT20 [Penicillium roqueforti]
MTVFIASLFLPYTIDFHINNSRARSPPLSPPSPPSVNPTIEGITPIPNSTASLFEKNLPGQTPGLTPGATTDHERIFAAQVGKTEHETNGYPFPLAVEQDNRLLTRSEGHSPVWGATTSLNQPKPAAVMSPSPSILKHQDPRPAKEPTHRPPAVETIASYARLRKASTASRKLSFSKAEWTIETAEQGNGGLRNAVRSATDAGGLDSMMWVGTLGMPTDALAKHTRRDIAEKLEDEYGSLTVFVNDSDFDGHYTHYCKTILWPVFHYQIPDNPKSKAYEDHSWIYYVKLNQAFADRIAKHWKRGDAIWVQDYHLLLVPAMLRKLVPDAQIGFFLHIAFPSSEVFKCLAQRKELLQGMLGANLIGFQTDEYCRHFLQTCSRILCVEATPEGIQLEDGFVNVGTFPIGIDPTSWDKRRRATDVERWVHAISERYQGKRLIVSRDKIDSVRGIRQKLLSYELFLNTYPEWADKVVLIQVATSTTEQPELEATISDIAMRINSTHSTLAHQPLVFLKQDLAFPQYLALITVADALMITSLREGMNLTSHEFVYCQDGRWGNKAYGSLILSEFTGSASVFGNRALLVNPWDYRQCCEAIHTALTRDEKERKEVWEEMYRAVLKNSTANWVKSFNETLTRVWNEQSSREIMAVPRLSVSRLTERYRQSKQRLMIIDYEDTLASWGSPRSIILTTPQRAITTLNELTEDPANVVYVMSARMPEEMERLFRQVNNLGLIAENGSFVREPNADSWTQLADKKHVKSWKASVSNILAYFHARVEGSWIEERHCSLVFHHGSAEDRQAAARSAAECAGNINDACANLGVHAIPVEGALIVETTHTNKASAAAHAWKWYMANADKKKDFIKPDFLLVIGDNREDEPVFRWANKLHSTKAVDYAMTVTLGSRSTEAKATLTQGVTGVLSCLQQLAAQQAPTKLPLRE